MEKAPRKLRNTLCAEGRTDENEMRNAFGSVTVQLKSSVIVCAFIASGNSLEQVEPIGERERAYPQPCNSHD